MIIGLKNLIKSCLRKFGLFATRVYPNDLTGFDLEEDLKRVVSKANPVIFDVGANEGQTIGMMQRIFASPQILSFEPAPKTFHSLKQKTFGNGVRLFHVGLGSKPDSLSFNEYEFSVLNSFYEVSLTQDNPFREVKKIGITTVAVETVDLVMRREGVECLDVLKIDTQGHDLEVLRGAQEGLAGGKIKHVLIEVLYSTLYKGQATAAEVQEFLVARGFRLVDLYEKHRHDHTIGWCTAIYRHCVV